ncbi:ATP-binding protein [Streptomyces sp. TRM 70361]|uniref:sensor histidine kinase n=1 Tax=Streptomyces sp. TRM 70361 TaxID=3116553 RepID=UPI002E7B909B|nr:ATP-binding protein [Streptomyces sp. TRM 70361]MEE1940880.1 ATP-binding protein [Streptomyces sp. TRM 70361]
MGGGDTHGGVGSGLQRAQAFLGLATLLYRASHLAVGIAAVAQHHNHRPAAWALLATAVATSVLVHGTAYSRGRFVPWTVAADVLLTGCALPFAAYAWAGAREAPSIAWTMVLGGSASAVAAVALRRRTAVCAVLLIVLTHAVGYRMVDAEVAVTGGHLNAVVFSAVIAQVLWWYLRRQGRLLDTATEQAVRAEAQRARYAERIAHYRALHDTVLATLTTIAHGTVDANSPEVRRRCAREAAYLRRLVQHGPDDPAAPRPEVGAALEGAVRDAEELGLRVTAQYHDLPAVPPDVATAFGDAVREALNNVLRHSGTGRAYLTAAGDDGHLLVTVVDRGAGFDPAATTGGTGLGLRSSIHARMRGTGGAAEVDSEPGEGTRVELRWPG